MGPHGYLMLAGWKGTAVCLIERPDGTITSNMALVATVSTYIDAFGIDPTLPGPGLSRFFAPYVTR